MSSSSDISSFEVVFSKGSGCYVEGEMISGEVIVDLKEDIVIENLQIIFRGTAVIRWPEGGIARSRGRGGVGNSGGRSCMTDDSAIDEEQYLNQMICLYNRETNPRQDILVSAGRHKYPFVIQLPETLPPSFRGDYGYLSYSATAVLERPFQSQVVATKEFSISSTVDLSSITPEIMKPVQSASRESLGFCCFETGHIICNWRLERRGFVPGDEIIINGEIQNNSQTRITRSKAALVQHTRYQSASGNVIHQRKKVTKLEKSDVPPGTIGFWRDKMTVPPSIPKTGLHGCNIIRIWYTLKFKVLLVMHKSIETDFEIVIGSHSVASTAGRHLRIIQHRHSDSTDNSSRPSSANDPDMTYFI